MIIGNDAGYGSKGLAQQTFVMGTVGQPKLGECSKRPELAEYMDRVAVAQKYTEELVGTLEDRLSGVMAPNSLNPADDAKTPQPAVTHYGGQLAALIQRQSVVNATLRGMLDRLEA